MLNFENLVNLCARQSCKYFLTFTDEMIGEYFRWNSHGIKSCCPNKQTATNDLNFAAILTSMKKYFTVLIFTSLVSGFLQAQIVPPDFLCVKADTLFWELPVNTCGPFVSYDIYTSNDLNGPYTLLASVSNPNQVFYRDPNPSGVLRYYFLQSNFDCPGLTPLASDTLDSRPPAVSPLKRVSVAGGDVLLSWEDSPSPEVSGYIIYRRDPIGVVPIDTVPIGTNTYLDPNAEPDMESESYFVNALDPCGNTSIFDMEHSTIFLEGAPTRCNVPLNWNLYDNWPNGIGSQEIWVGTNGGTPVFQETIPPDADSFVFAAVNDGESYCFVLQAIENNTGEISRSNEFCVNTGYAQPINELFLANVNVEADNRVTIDWGMNANADIALVEIMRLDGNGGFEIISTETPQGPTPAFNEYLDQNVNAGMGAQTYRVVVTDSCGNQLTSTTGTTIFLSGNQLNATTSELNWTPLEIENAVVFDYEIVRIANGGETSVGTVGSNVFSLEDNFDLSAIADGTICYYVEATGEVLSPDGVPMNITSRSNTLCFDQEVKIFTPNALAPDGFNQEFKPVILSGNIARYEMQIFDRYGGIVFSADAPEEGWKGKKNGRKLPQGVYVYRIVLTLESGDKAEKSGHVLLLR